MASGKGFEHSFLVLNFVVSLATIGLAWFLFKETQEQVRIAQEALKSSNASSKSSDSATRLSLQYTQEAIADNKLVVKEAKRNNELTDLHYKIANRAYVVMTHAKVEYSVGLVIKCEVQVENTGKTPALNEKGYFYMYESDKGPLPIRKIKNPTMTTMGAGDARIINVLSDYVISNEMDEVIKSGKIKIYVAGYLEYQDIYGDNHTSVYNLWLNPDVKAVTAVGGDNYSN